MLLIVWLLIETMHSHELHHHSLHIGTNKNFFNGCIVSSASKFSSYLCVSQLGFHNFSYINKFKRNIVDSWYLINRAENGCKNTFFLIHQRDFGIRVKIFILIIISNFSG